MKTYLFDENKERSLLMTQDKDNHQLSHPKDGVTRVMQQEFFDRRNIWNKAHNHKTFWNRYDDSYVNDIVTVYGVPVFKPFGIVELHKEDNTCFVAYNSKQHKIIVEYIKSIFTKPSYLEE